MEISCAALFKQGAEARLFRISYLGKPAILKERFKKMYRNEELDVRLTKERIRAEAKSILRCKNAGIHVPTVYLIDIESRRIVLECIVNSKTVSERIAELTSTVDDAEEKLEEIAVRMGSVIGKMHYNNIIHGDLTTSNILLKFESDEAQWELYLIDFGLSYTKSSDEDKAVDLYVLERALTSKHSDVCWFFDSFLKSYAAFHKNCENIVKKFQAVRSRGRKRTMIG